MSATTQTRTRGKQRGISRSLNENPANATKKLTVHGTVKEFFKKHGLVPESEIRASKNEFNPAPILRFRVTKDVQLGNDKLYTVKNEDGQIANYGIVLSKNASAYLADGDTEDLACVGVQITAEDCDILKVAERTNDDGEYQGFIIITNSGNEFVAANLW
jgi:hypothetical protein